eukprot:g30588.t1
MRLQSTLKCRIKKGCVIMASSRLEQQVVLRKQGDCQKDTDRLEQWTKKWQIEHNVGKHEVVHFEEIYKNYTGDEDWSYQEWLRTVGLYSMEFRRMRSDLIETYTIFRGLDTVDVEK